MKELYEELAGVAVDDVDGVEQLFRRIHDISKLKHYDPALWARLRGEWKARSIPMLAELDKAVDRHMREVDRRNRVSARDGFERSKTGAIIPHHANAMLAIEKMGVTLKYDQFVGQPMAEGLPAGYSPVLDDPGVNRLWVACEQQFDFRPSLTNFSIWVGDAAYQNGFHPVRDYLDGLEWDGVPRIDTWLANYCAAEDTAFNRAAGAIWMVAAVRRVREPGCKFDEMLILESSKQGLRKSTALATLAVRDAWFSDSVQLSVSEKEMIESTSGIWIAEVSEMQGLRKGDIEKVKAQVSRRFDRARLAYGRLPKTHPRQGVYAGTTNGGKTSRYLIDPSGNRRFWPVEVGLCDVDALERDRDQLWAEAAAREAQGASIRLPQELWPEAEAAQADRAVGNAFADELAEALGGREGAIRASDGWKLLNVAVERRDMHASKFGAAWKLLGWERRNWRRGGQQVAFYVKGNGARELIVVEDGRDVSVRFADEYHDDPDEGL